MRIKKTVVVIAGPTAVGKTAVAIALAQHLGTAVISADSRQCYREMKIGVARPAENELNAVPHYFIANHSIEEKITAASYEAEALRICDELFRTHDTVVLCGGTGLYIRAFMEGMDDIPAVPEIIHEEVANSYEEQGMTWLQQAVEKEDPLYFAKGEILNPHRLMRALEVKRATGQSITFFQKGNKKQRPFRIITVALELPREELKQRINRRVDIMIEEGLLEEVRSLYSQRALPALQTVGYQELFQYLDGSITLEDAIALIKKNTRAYAKRQMTWFRKDPSWHWLPPSAEEVIAYVQKEL